MSPRIPDELIEDAINIIINTRDLCGNEHRAVVEWMTDEHLLIKYPGLDGNKLYRIANFRANARWNGFKKQAGVPAKYTW